jgi:hypothetical protein
MPDMFEVGRATSRGTTTKVFTNAPLSLRAVWELSAAHGDAPYLVFKQGLRLALDPDWTELGAWVSRSLAELFGTYDHREGVAAFLERREPRYRGR